MVYFTLTLDEENRYSYVISEVNSDVKKLNPNDLIFYSDVDILEGGSIDFWELSDYGIYSGNVYKIIDSYGEIATVIDYDDIYDVQDFIYYETERIIVKIDYLSYSLGRNLVSIQDRTGEILCDICEVDIPVYS
jgi:hypothetical protein